MKRMLGISAVLFLVIWLAPCTGGGRSDAEDTAAVPASSAGALVILDSGAWPENEYTEHIPRLDAGTVTGGWIDMEQDYCYIESSGVDETDAENYLETLEQNGFQEIEEVSEQIEGQADVSTGVLLSNGEAALSIACFQDYFGMYIHVSG